MNRSYLAAFSHLVHKACPESLAAQRIRRSDTACFRAWSRLSAPAPRVRLPATAASTTTWIAWGRSRALPMPLRPHGHGGSDVQRVHTPVANPAMIG